MKIQNVECIHRYWFENLLIFLCFYKNNTLKISLFIILRIVDLVAREVFIFLKKWANFYFILLFLNICQQILHVSRAHISKRKMCFNVKSSIYYFHVKAKILADFKICISVPAVYFFHKGFILDIWLGSKYTSKSNRPSFKSEQV